MQPTETANCPECGRSIGTYHANSQNSRRPKDRLCQHRKDAESADICQGSYSVVGYEPYTPDPRI